MSVDGKRSWPSDQVQTALDASCAALLALEQAHGAMCEADAELERSKQAEVQAMELVRVAISDLRRFARSSAPSALALGFVQPQGEPSPAPGTS